MGIWNYVAKKIQATEGAQNNVLLESLLTATPLGSSGTDNVYRNYAAQTTAIYRKYNGRDELGNWQLRTVIDTRTGFICGEGISISGKDSTQQFINDVIEKNRLNGSTFIDAIKTGEMEGRVLIMAAPDHKKKTVKFKRVNSGYCGGNNYEVFLRDVTDPESLGTVKIKSKDGNERTVSKNFVYARLGGDSSKANETTTRAGLILKNIESYDRGLNAMRHNNHLFGRVTPFLSTDNAQDVARFEKLVSGKNWKIGNALAAVKSKFEMIVPSVGAMDNIKAELLSNAKVISSVTGIPIHWLGWVDAMSNRATADSLYETINNATINDRVKWQEALYKFFVMAQEIAIDNGFITGPIDYDFEVKIPLVSFYKMKERIEGLSLAYNDNAISMDDYRNALPGIDPYKTAQAIKRDAEDIPGILDGLKNDRSFNDGETEDNKTED